MLTVVANKKGLRKGLTEWANRKGLTEEAGRK